MHLEKYSSLMKKLENDELEQNIAGEEFYIQLFALYLYHDELVDAKQLLKRIPQASKGDNKELERLKVLLRALVNNNSPEFFRNIHFAWSDNIKGIMDDLGEKLRNDVLTLVGQAYTFIFEQQLMQLTHLSREDLKVACLARDWAYDGDGPQALVVPKRPYNVPRACTSSEDQLFKLTDFVSFLEN